MFIYIYIYKYVYYNKKSTITKRIIDRQYTTQAILSFHKHQTDIGDRAGIANRILFMQYITQAILTLHKQQTDIGDRAGSAKDKAGQATGSRPYATGMPSK